MATPKEQVEEIEFKPKPFEYSGIWFTISECHYTGCSEVVYGDLDSVIGMRVFCKYHYGVMREFLDSCDNYWQIVSRVGGDT